MKKHKVLLYSLLIVTAIIASISFGSIIGGNTYYIFYNLVYGLLLSTALPLWLAHKGSGALLSLGVKKLGIKQVIVVFCFVAFSIGGQLISLDISSLNFGFLRAGFVPLIMTTFFEEFLFRGYMQTRFEKQYGWITAVLLSGFFFSIYHLGYPGFRALSDLLLLFAVGVGFALAFKLAGGNVAASYLVNLPNAFLTYILKLEQFPPFDDNTTPVAIITIIIILIVLTGFAKLAPRHNNEV